MRQLLAGSLVSALTDLRHRSFLQQSEGLLRSRTLKVTALILACHIVSLQYEDTVYLCPLGQVPVRLTVDCKNQGNSRKSLDARALMFIESLSMLPRLPFAYKEPFAHMRVWRWTVANSTISSVSLSFSVHLLSFHCHLLAGCKGNAVTRPPPDSKFLPISHCSACHPLTMKHRGGVVKQIIEKSNIWEAQQPCVLSKYFWQVQCSLGAMELGCRRVQPSAWGRCLMQNSNWSSTKARAAPRLSRQ